MFIYSQCNWGRYYFMPVTLTENEHKFSEISLIFLPTIPSKISKFHKTTTYIHNLLKNI